MKSGRCPREWLGRVQGLIVDRVGTDGARLRGESAEMGTVTLPRGEVPEGTKAGDGLEVFVHLDSKGGAVATMSRPKVELGDVAFLEVVDEAPFGAFVDWGLPKQLLVPRAEQTAPMPVGGRHAIGLYLDDSGRLAGTMRVAEMLESTPPFAPDAWVSGEAWRNEPRIGVFVIVERRYVGLLPAQEPHGLSRGDAALFRVATVLADGKITLSLRGHAEDERRGDAERIAEVLRRSRARVGDHTSPAEIRSRFGLSKKAFKRAVGLLLKEERVTFDGEGNLVIPRSRRIVG